MRAGPGRAPSPGQSAARAGSRELGAASGGGGRGPRPLCRSPPPHTPHRPRSRWGQRDRDHHPHPPLRKPAFSGPVPLSFCSVSASLCPPVCEPLSLSPCPPTLVLCPSAWKSCPSCLSPFLLAALSPTSPSFVPHLCPLVSAPFYRVTLSPHHPLHSPSLSLCISALRLCPHSPSLSPSHCHPCFSVPFPLSPICPILSSLSLSFLSVSLAPSVTSLPRSPHYPSPPLCPSVPLSPASLLPSLPLQPP